VLIDGFQIPPFLLPIYQAAGERYALPWQVLAAINEVETDYGRNLSISSAGAEGWMQFLPQTWARYGVDAVGRGVADPYAPADAIFAAAHYLDSAGGGARLPSAIFAYNHASWYVDSVLLRAKLIESYPPTLTAALDALMAARFPVSGTVLGYRERAWPAPIDQASTAREAVINAHPGAVAIAAADAVVERIGDTPALGRYIVLRDAFGDHFTYSHVASLEHVYPAFAWIQPRAHDALVPSLLAATPHGSPHPLDPGLRDALEKWAASAGDSGNEPSNALVAQPVATVARPTSSLAAAPHRAHYPNRTGSRYALGRSATVLPLPSAGAHVRDTRFVAPAGAIAGPAAGPQMGTPAAKERLFAYPWRPASYAAGGAIQLLGADPNAFTVPTGGLPPGRYRREPLVAGAIVTAGTTLGRLSQADGRATMGFQITPPGPSGASIDPLPVLDSWRREAQAGILAASRRSPLGEALDRRLTAGLVVLMTTPQLERLVHLSRWPTGTCAASSSVRESVERRVLIAVAYLTVQGLTPTATVDCAGAGRTSGKLMISALDGIPLGQDQQQRSAVTQTIMQLASLPMGVAPTRVTAPSTSVPALRTSSSAGASDSIELDYTTHSGAPSLTEGQWSELVGRLERFEEPIVPSRPTAYAIPDPSPKEGDR
jgi:hypothetical protein